MKNSFFLEGYGCSLNVGETEQISWFLKNNNFRKVADYKKADFLLINTCSVKMVTEQRMLSRIHFFLNNKKKNSKIIVVGCLAKTNKEVIQKISKDVVVLDTDLKSIANFFSLKKISFSPKILHDNKFESIAIIPISVGCVGNCSYCATKIARGNLKSYSIKDINFSFKKALKNSKEIWLTSQDLGCYGFDKNLILPDLIKVLLKNKGDYRIRLGMMNPKHFKKISKKLIPLFRDERLYKFLHLPVQSGSNKILKLMNRKSDKEDFINAVNILRKKIPNIRISTDIIVGFPGESEDDFNLSLDLIKLTKPNVLNISRFGKRPGTIAAKMEFQIPEMVKKQRSKKLSEYSKKIFLEENKKIVGEELIALVSEKAEKNGFIARTNNYSPIVVKNGFGKFLKIRVKEAFPHFFKGEIVDFLK